MAQDILLVDDDRISLENFGNDVRLNLGIEPYLATNAKEAIVILRDYPIKVLVTDQLMPEMKGTELVRYVREVMKLTIPCIMLTAHHDRTDTFDIGNLHFFGFIDKMNTHAELTQKIREAIQQFDREEAHKYSLTLDKILIKKGPFLLFRPHITLKLKRISSIIDPYIRELDWNTDYIAQRNISSTQKINIHRRVACSYDYGAATEVLSQFGLKISKLVSELNSTLQHKISLTENIKFEGELVVEAEQTLEVKEISDSPNSEELILQTRLYQSAPVYTRVNCLLEIECNCCQIPRNFSISVDLLTDRIALRQVEQFDKGPEKKIPTLIIKGNLVQ